MVRRKNTVVRSYSIRKANAKWFSEKCDEEDLSQSAVMNRMIKKMRESGKGILWM